MTKQELATKIWATANELRKNIKASEYKDYILGFMFYKYLCDKETDYLHDLGGEETDLLEADDAVMENFKDEIGYFIKHKDLFSTWKTMGVNLGAKDVSEALDSFYLNLNGKYKKVFDKVFSALQSGLTKLGENSGSRDKAVRDIVDLVDSIPPTSRNYDVLGYIYEYLIQQFSSEAKKDGAFYTPHELTSLMARIIAERLKGRDEVCCYDPTVGSGGLLLNIGKEVGKYVPSDNIKYYGQELITETMNLAKMNLFMQGVPVQNINMRNANTLEDDWPYFDEQTAYYPLYVDAVVSNPPYSAHWEPEAHKTDERFRRYGLAPQGKADLAFLLHCLYHIKDNGIMAIVLPHGVLFRGDSEGEIRKNLILNHNIETIISLPSQLFFATGIPVIVMILSKNREADDILFIDASQSFKKDKKQNVLRESDVKRIFDAVIARKDIRNFAHLASLDEIERNDYNLNVPRYVSAKTDEAPYDLYSVMTGMVSDKELEIFSSIWDKFPALKDKLLVKENGYSTFANVNCKDVIFNDDDVREYISDFTGTSESFRTYLIDKLIDNMAAPSVNTEITENLFAMFKDMLLTNIYDIYQAYVDQWGTVDTDLIRLETEGNGILTETEPNMITKKDSKTKQTVEEQKGWKGKIFPFDLIKKTYFIDDFNKVHELEAEAGAKASEYEDIWENLDDEIKSNVSKDDDESAFDAKKIKAAIKNGDIDKDTGADFKAMLKAIDEEKVINKKIKTILSELDIKAKEKIESLTEDEVKDLLKKKWIDPVIDAINSTGESVLTKFISDFTAIKKKYSDPLADLSGEIEETGKALKDSLMELTGSDADMDAIKMLLEEL